MSLAFSENILAWEQNKERLRVFFFFFFFFFMFQILKMLYNNLHQLLAYIDLLHALNMNP